MMAQPTAQARRLMQVRTRQLAERNGTEAVDKLNIGLAQALFDLVDACACEYEHLPEMVKRKLGLAIIALQKAEI